MKIARNASGQELADPLCRHWDYVFVTQVGSHMMLRTATPNRGKQVIPAHTPVKIGTLSTILNQVAAHKLVGRDDLLRDL